MTVLTAEILRDELQRHTDDFMASLRSAIRKEMEQYFGEKVDISKSSSLDISRMPSEKTLTAPRVGSQFRLHASGRKQSFNAMSSTPLARLSAPVHTAQGRGSVRFGSQFIQDDADCKLSAAIEPKVLHWKRGKSSHAVADFAVDNFDASKNVKNSCQELVQDSRPDNLSSRMSCTLSPRGQDLPGIWPSPSLKNDVPGPLSSVMGRRSWQSSHRNSFRQLGLVQEKLKEPSSYQALLPASDPELEDELTELKENLKDDQPQSRSSVLFDDQHQSRSSVLFDDQHQSRSSVLNVRTSLLAEGTRKSVLMDRQASNNRGSVARPRRTMNRESISNEGWMHRFRKGNTPAESGFSDRGEPGNEDVEEEMDEESEDGGTRETTCCQSFRAAIENSIWCAGVPCMEDLVSSTKFNTTSGALVIFNAISIGVQTDYMAVHWCQEVPHIFRVLERIFCVLFSTELALRLVAYGFRFWYMAGWRWNLFDTMMVLLQVTEVYLEKDFQSSENGALNHWSSFRMLRLVRIIRLARILHLISELRMLVVSISHSIRSLGWVVLLLLVMIYVIAVYLTQIVTDHKVYASKEALKEEEALLHFYGSLDRSVLSLYAMVSEGIHWDQLMDPLAEHISPWLRLLFFFFSAFAIFAVMNVVTGVFVESALTTATEDRKVSITAQMKTLFEKVDDDGSGDITWEEFQEHLSHPQMQACLKEIDVNNDDAHELFRLLDINNSGTIDIDELVHGCLRLMGWAKAIDLATFMNEYRIVTLRWARHARFVEECLDIIQTKLECSSRPDINRRSILEEEEYMEYVDSMSIASYSRNSLS